MAKKTTKKAAAKKAPAKKAAPKKATTKKVAAKKAPAKKAPAKKAPAKKAARKPNAAFMQALTPSAELAAVIGAAAAARTEVVKKLWAYIKKHNLQNPKNKRNILADDKLAKLFGKKEVSMFELASLIGKHLK
jgi:upstream activation factor subunit UAF30